MEGPADTSTKSRTGFRQGIITTDTFAGSSEQSFASAAVVANKHDSEAFLAMLSDERIYTISAGTEVDALDAGHGISLIFVRSGRLIDRKLYMFSDQIRPVETPAK